MNKVLRYFDVEINSENKTGTTGCVVELQRAFPGRKVVVVIFYYGYLPVRPKLTNKQSCLSNGRMYNPAEKGDSTGVGKTVVVVQGEDLIAGGFPAPPIGTSAGGE